MAVDDQCYQPIPVTMPVALEGGQQLVHFGLGKMLPDPVGIIPPPPLGETGRITNKFARPPDQPSPPGLPCMVLTTTRESAHSGRRAEIIREFGNREFALGSGEYGN